MENEQYPASQDVAPLVDWEKVPTIRELKLDLEAAKPIHDNQVKQIEGWLDNLHVRNGAKIKPKPGSSGITPKLIRKQAEWRYASLTEPFLSTDDIFNVRPVTWEDRDAAKQNELLLNNQLNTRIDKVKFIDEYVRTAVDEGTLIVQVGWAFEEESYEAKEPVVEFVVDPEVAPMHEYLAEMKKSSPSQWATDVPDEIKEAHELTIEKGVPIKAVIKGEKDVIKTRIVKNHPTLDVCDFRNVVIDPTCFGDVDKAKFIVKSFESCLADLKAEGKKYKNLDQINIEGNSVLGTPDHSSPGETQNFNFDDKDRKKFVVYEYWGYRVIDAAGKLKPIVAAWVGDTMIRLEESPFADGKLPFVVEHYLPVRKNNYGEPDGALLEDNQKILGAVTRGMIDIMGRSANGQVGMSKQFLDATNRRKFEKGLDYEFNAGFDPRANVHMHTYPEIPMSAQFMLQLQNQEAESLTGVRSFSQGVSGASLGDVAAGIRGALDAASKRELGILRRLSNGMIKIGRKIIAMNATLLSEEEVVRVTNDEFVKVRRDDLGGSFDLRLSISTAEEDNNKAQELGFMLQTMGPNMDPTLGQMILADIARLRKMPDVAQRIENYKPEPDPMMQRKMQLEVQLLEAQLANEMAQAKKLNAGAVLDQAKTGTEVAKARMISSDTDLKDLNFVEQESGTKQVRDLEKIGEQARSQAQLKLIDRDIQREKLGADIFKEQIKKKAK
jgi:hypothetical protein